VKLRRDQVLSAWTGWRPLAKDPNVAAEDGPISRDHVISENPETGVIFVAGGKWTTWRQMAEEVVDRIVGPRGPPCQTLAIKLHGGDGYTVDLPYQLLQTYSGLSEDVAQHLARTYGSRAWEVCELATVSGTPLWPQLGAPLVAGFPYIDAEVRYACREYAVTIEDVLSRRTRLAFLNKKAAVSAIPVVADLMASELGWSLAEKRKHMRSARLYLESYGGSVPESADVLLREASQESPQRLFVTLDRDGSGYIDYEEVSEAVSILGLNLSDGQLERVFERMDVSKKGRVSADEFAAWWTKFRGSKAFDELMSSLGDSGSSSSKGVGAGTSPSATAAAAEGGR
jgi:glycerol-3-phosphate dehydrogenase